MPVKLSACALTTLDISFSTKLSPFAHHFCASLIRRYTLLGLIETYRSVLHHLNRSICQIGGFVLFQHGSIFENMMVCFQRQQLVFVADRITH